MNDEDTISINAPPNRPVRRNAFGSLFSNGWFIAVVTGFVFLGISYLLTRLPPEKPGLTCITTAKSYGKRLSAIVFTLTNSGERHLSNVQGSLTFSEPLKDYASILLDDPAALVTKSNNNRTLQFSIPELPVGLETDLIVIFDKAAGVDAHDVTALHFYDHHGRLQKERISARFVAKKLLPKKARLSSLFLIGSLVVVGLLLLSLSIIVIRRRLSNAPAR